MKRYCEMEEKLKKSDKYIKKIENKLTQAELDNRFYKTKTTKMIELLTEVGCPIDKIDEINQECDYHTNDETGSVK